MLLPTLCSCEPLMIQQDSGREIIGCADSIGKKQFTRPSNQNVCVSPIYICKKLHGNIQRTEHRHKKNGKIGSIPTLRTTLMKHTASIMRARPRV